MTSRFALFVKKMKTATLWERLYFLLSEEKKEEWAKRYKKRFGKEFIPPTKDKRAIECETKIEDTTEIARIMEQKPGYSVDVQERER